MQNEDEYGAIVVCKCGCGGLVEERHGAGRKALYAKKSCGTIVTKARLAGWTEGSDMTPRAFLTMRKASVMPTKKEKKLADRAEGIQFVNPRICVCGCGRPAQYHAAGCARKTKDEPIDTTPDLKGVRKLFKELLAKFPDAHKYFRVVYTKAGQEAFAPPQPEYEGRQELSEETLDGLNPPWKE